MAVHDPARRASPTDCSYVSRSTQQLGGGSRDTARFDLSDLDLREIRGEVNVPLVVALVTRRPEQYVRNPGLCQCCGIGDAAGVGAVLQLGSGTRAPRSLPAHEREKANHDTQEREHYRSPQRLLGPVMVSLSDSRCLSWLLLGVTATQIRSWLGFGSRTIRQTSVNLTIDDAETFIGTLDGNEEEAGRIGL